MAFKQKIPDCSPTHEPFNPSTYYVQKNEQFVNGSKISSVTTRVPIADIQQDFPEPDVFNIENSLKSGKNLSQVSSTVLHESSDSIVNHANEAIKRFEDNQPLNE